MREVPLTRRVTGPCWALPIVLVCTLACGGGDDDDDACDGIDPPRETQLYGQPCEAMTHGSCETVFDNCVQGWCLTTKNGMVCTQNCASTSECPSGMYCVANSDTTMACTPAASCETTCDEVACCIYEPVPGDPTSCVLKECVTGGH
jgi:hypothetical protein